MPPTTTAEQTASRPAALLTGLDRAAADPALLGADPIALVTNYTSVTHDLRRGVDVLAGVCDVRAICVPEHGYWGAVQAGESEAGAPDARTGIRVLDTYRVEGGDLEELVAGTGAPRLVVDLQDVGTRFYTYVWTLLDVMTAAARTGLAVTVLDRPNPLGLDQPSGPGLEDGCASFVGRENVPLVHGLTIGELARWFAAEFVPARAGLAVECDVVAMTGDGGELPTGEVAAAAMTWVPPSPNMPTRTTAHLYPGTGLLEGTVLSEGRGTTTPFELLGAPWLDGSLADALRDRDLPGVAFREAWFRPTFAKHAGELCGGVQVHVTDAAALDPVRTGVAILDTVRRVAPDAPLWRAAAPGGPPFADLLWGSPALREGVSDGGAYDEIVAAGPRPLTPPDEARIYPRAIGYPGAGES